MLYASYTRGYKGKAINLVNGLSQTVIRSGHAVLAPEIPKSYEVGMRSRWLDRRLILNLTAFWTNFNNFQSQSYDAALVAFTLANAGNLRSRGLEGEATYAAFRGLNLATSVVFTANNVDDYVIPCYPGQTAAQGCLKGQENVSGARLVNSPRWAFTTSGDYTHELGLGSYAGFVSATLHLSLPGELHVQRSARCSVGVWRVELEPGGGDRGSSVQDLRICQECARQALRARDRQHAL